MRSNMKRSERKKGVVAAIKIRSEKCLTSTLKTIASAMDMHPSSYLLDIVLECLEDDLIDGDRIPYRQSGKVTERWIFASKGGLHCETKDTLKTAENSDQMRLL